MADKGLPKTVPVSSIDFDRLRTLIEEAVTERLQREKEMKEPTKWRPYMDLSEMRGKHRKDFTGQFKEVYKLFEKDFRSNDPKTRNFAHLKYGAVLKEIAGRPLKETEIKMITIQCLKRKPSMRINAFGQLYTNKVILPEDTEKK